MEERTGTGGGGGKFGMFIHWGCTRCRRAATPGAKAAATPMDHARSAHTGRNTGPSPGALTRWTLTRTPSSASAARRACAISSSPPSITTSSPCTIPASRYNIVDATPLAGTWPWNSNRPATAMACACVLLFAGAGLGLPRRAGGRQDRIPGGVSGYLEQKCLPQVRELLEGYGPLGLVWYDTPMDMPRADCLRMRDLVRTLQPDCLVSGRVEPRAGRLHDHRRRLHPLLAWTAPSRCPPP